MFPSSSGGSGDDCRSDRTEIKIKKLISTAEKFKNKYSLGEQVNKELMKRCEQLKVDIGVSNQKLEAVSAALESLCVDGDLPDPLLRAIEDMRLIIDPQFRLGLEHRDSHHNAGDGSRGRARSVFLNNTEGTSLIRRSNADDAPDDLAFDDSRSSSAVGESACRPGADDADGEAPAASRRASARISIGSTGAEGIGSKKSAPLFEVSVIATASFPSILIAATTLLSAFSCRGRSARSRRRVRSEAPRPRGEQLLLLETIHQLHEQQR